LPQDVAAYHLETAGSRDFTGSFLLAPGTDGAEGRVGYRFRPAGDEPGSETAAGERTWGWGPRLPAMMGGGFLPLVRGYCRFYQVGWHNLPGFGLGGLVYAARQAAVRIWTHDLHKDPDGLKSSVGD